MIGDTLSVVLLWVLKVHLLVLAVAAATMFAWLLRDSIRRRRASGTDATLDPVPDAVKNAASRCPHSFSCVETGMCGDRSLCEVAYADGDNSLVLVSRGKTACPYCTTTPHGHTCVCPVHCHLNSRTAARPDGCALEGFAPGVITEHAVRQPAAARCR
jgi:hypothetical protein